MSESDKAKKAHIANGICLERHLPAQAVVSLSRLGGEAVSASARRSPVSPSTRDEFARES